MGKPKRRILYVIIVLLLAVAVAEVAMRIVFGMQGYTVGSFAPNWFPNISESKEPVLINSYYTDDRAIFRANRSFWNKEGVAVNTLGFLGREWTMEINTQTKLFLIGDSFVWGAGAEPLSNSFAAKLSHGNRFQVLNSGIPGADPAQYDLIANLFVPLLQPDYVVVFVYLGNDLMIEERKPLANKALYFPTDVGWFPGCYKGSYFDNFEASNNFYKVKYGPSNWFQQVASHTAIGTAICSLPLRFEEKKERAAQLQSSITNGYLKAILASIDTKATQLIIIPIPFSGDDFNKEYSLDAKKYLINRYHNAFEGLDAYIAVAPLGPEHYHPMPDGHFNNAGHQLMADFVTGVVASKVHTQP